MAGMPIRRRRKEAEEARRLGQDAEEYRERTKEKWLQIREALKGEKQAFALQAASDVLQAGIVPICTRTSY